MAAGSPSTSRQSVRYTSRLGSLGSIVSTCSLLILRTTPRARQRAKFNQENFEGWNREKFQLFSGMGGLEAQWRLVSNAHNGFISLYYTYKRRSLRWSGVDFGFLPCFLCWCLAFWPQLPSFFARAPKSPIYTILCLLVYLQVESMHR